MKFVITSPFGALEALREGHSHTGIDLATPMHSPLRSFCDAVVEKVTDYGPVNIGKGVILKLHDGTRYIYGHMDSVNVHAGDKVHAGSLLGLSGSSGNSTGPHLHFGEWINGKYVDPSDVIDKVDAFAGSTFVVPKHGVLTDLIVNKVREHAKETATDTILGTLDAIRDIVLDTEYSIFLIGTGILVMLRAVGFKHPWIRPGVMMTLHVIIRLLLGGFVV